MQDIISYFICVDFGAKRGLDVLLAGFGDGIYSGSRWTDHSQESSLKLLFLVTDRSFVCLFLSVLVAWFHTFETDAEKLCCNTWIQVCVSVCISSCLLREDGGAFLKSFVYSYRAVDSSDWTRVHMWVCVCLCCVCVCWVAFWVWNKTLLMDKSWFMWVSFCVCAAGCFLYNLPNCGENCEMFKLSCECEFFQLHKS